MTYEDINLGSIWCLNLNRLEVVGINIGIDRVINVSYRYLSQYSRVCSMPVVDFLSTFNEEIPPNESPEILENRVYELSQYDHLLDSIYYWHFKNNPTVLRRLIRELREVIRADDGYYEGDLRDNIEVLHNLKSVNSIEELKVVIGKVGFKLELKELL